jgi:DNA-directed RNA polymerase beta subunit
MNKSQIDDILSKVQKQASAVAKVRSILPNRRVDANDNGIPDDEEEYVPVGVKGLLSASQKLLAVNRGLDKTDERDSLLFKRILTTDRLLSERVRLDNDRVRGAMMPLIARHKNLRAVGPFAFDSYMEKFLIGNPLSSPLEEINPLHLLEQSRRATQMGPGGIGTDNAITEDMQAIRVDQFGFISTLEGPESEKIGIDTRMAWGSKIGSDGRPYQKFLNRRTGKYQWMSPEDLDGLTVKLPD